MFKCKAKGSRGEIKGKVSGDNREDKELEETRLHETKY